MRRILSRQQLALCLLISTCFLSACKGSRKTSAAAEASQPVPVATPPQKQPSSQSENTNPAPATSLAKAEESAQTLFSGLFRERDGKLEFLPCDDPNQTYWVIGQTDTLMRLYQDAIRQGYPGQSVVVDLRGQLVSKTDNSRGAAMASPYDAQLRVTMVEKLRHKNPRNTCLPYTFWALGNEPFWSVQISKVEQLIEFQLLGQPTQRLTYVEPVYDEIQKTWRYVVDANGQRLKINIKAEPCIDDMAGNPYPLSSSIEWGGRQLTGCARTPD